MFGFFKKQLPSGPYFTSKEIRGLLKPYLKKNVWLTDSEYSKVDSKTGFEILDKTHKEMPYYIRIFECEEFALTSLARLREYHALLYQENKTEYDCNFPIGICSGTMFKGERYDHTLIVCVFTDGVFMYDPQSKRKWKSDPKTDKFFFVWM